MSTGGGTGPGSGSGAGTGGLDFNINAPTPDQVTALINGPIVANSVANPTQINAVNKAVIAKGLTASKAPIFWLAFVLACVDQGSSSFVQLDGSAENVTFALAAFEVRKVCTLRQFCMAFAKVAFGHMVANNRPPANWQRKGFTLATRFAAFDFFNGVTHAAAIEPTQGARDPTLEEIKAGQANAAALIRSSRADQVLTTNGNVAIMQQTMSGMRPQLGWSG